MINVWSAHRAARRPRKVALAGEWRLTGAWSSATSASGRIRHRPLRSKTGRAGRRECAGAAPTSVRPGRIVVRASVIPLFSTVARRRDHAAKTDRCYWVMPPSRCWAFVIGDPEQCRCLFPSLFDQREHGRTKPVIAHAAVESLAVRVVPPCAGR